MPKARLLVVEDEPNLLSGIRDILELDGYHVLTAQNGREALEVLDGLGENTPNLIVSDIMMPYIDGLQLLREVRKNADWVMIPFIFLTAKGSKQDMQQGKMLGVDDYLVKPFDADDLLVAVESRLERHRTFHQAKDSAISEIKRSILTILNHEFRTPLTLVVAYADMLKEGNVADMEKDELVMFLKEINNGADRLRRLIENFIMLVELETGDAQKTYEWRRHPIDNLETLLQNAIKRACESHRMEHYPCEISMIKPLPIIIGDPDYITMMITELLINAIKFSKEELRIHLEVEGIDDELHLRVIDTGRGIPPEKITRIWEKFTQIDREQHEDQGAGSGLAIVKGLADLHHAKIDVESIPDKRTCFTLIFPALTQG
jgi:signal transduction histidine kinase